VETTTGKELIRVTHEGTVRALAFSPDGRYLATGSGYNTARVVETTSGKEFLRVTHEEAVYDVAFSADGRYLATGSGDNTARVVETTSGKEIIRVMHEGCCCCRRRVQLRWACPVHLDSEGESRDAAPSSSPRRGPHRRDLCTSDEEPERPRSGRDTSVHPLSQDLRSPGIHDRGPLMPSDNSTGAWMAPWKRARRGPSITRRKKRQRAHAKRRQARSDRRFSAPGCAALETASAPSSGGVRGHCGYPPGFPAGAGPWALNPCRWLQFSAIRPRSV
jgi:WD domain, G-beta repeat